METEESFVSQTIVTYVQTKRPARPELDGPKPHVYDGRHPLYAPLRVPHLMPLRKSKDGRAEVVAWESRSGKLHVHRDGEGKRKGRAPGDRELKRAKRIIFQYDEDYYTITGGIEPDYDLDRVIDTIESDVYKETAS